MPTMLNPAGHFKKNNVQAKHITRTSTSTGNDAMVQIILTLANVAMGLCCGGVGVLMVFYGPAEWSVGVEDAEVESPVWVMCENQIGH